MISIVILASPIRAKLLAIEYSGRIIFHKVYTCSLKSRDSRYLKLLKRAVFSQAIGFRTERSRTFACFNWKQTSSFRLARFPTSEWSDRENLREEYSISSRNELPGE
ncbi:hypothetical protein HZH66_009587 [Vespula vulgaris]|uniref:Uncharacterized protein n=1 Tax=Vespula vulgaris TaxID=7454 RepID=A0A834JPU7_VESVU|nr:hypothetical protein HZH66_009587 [Vespula vulgaris]